MADRTRLAQPLDLPPARLVRRPVGLLFVTMRLSHPALNRLPRDFIS